MGINVNGQIAFGVTFEDGFEFPWDHEEYDGIEAWWMEVNGYEPIYQPFTPDGQYADGWDRDDPRLEEHYQSRRSWLEDNPIPVVDINTCSGDYPVYMLAIPDTLTGCSWDSPTKLSKTRMADPVPEKVKAMIDFLANHEIDCDNEPAWWLTSYYSG